MELFIHLGTNLEYFRLLNEGYLLSQGKKDRDLGMFFAKNFPGELAETISPQYETNFLGIREIKGKFGPDSFNKIGGIYFGSDNCEYLVPHKREVEGAINLFREFNEKFPPHKVRSFTLVTPYVGDKMMGVLKESLSYLNELKIKNPIEIVVNDYGVLRILKNEFPNLKPIMGRVIHKIMKTPLIDTYGYNVHPAGEHIKNKSKAEIEKLKENIKSWQLKFYASSEVSLPQYRGFLSKNAVERVAIDYMEKRPGLFENDRYGDIGIDVYYPWAIVMTGRLCDTSAVDNPQRGNYALDEICPRTCNKYDVFYKIKTNDYNLVQRGNSGYRSELSLDYLPEEFTKNGNNRLVFAPFITV